MERNQLVEVSRAFSVELMQVYNILKREGSLNPVFPSLLKSGTDIGVHIHAANYAHSKTNFLDLMQEALKSCYETEYWLEVFSQSQILPDELYESLSIKCSKMRRMLINTVNTTRRNMEHESTQV